MDRVVGLAGGLLFSQAPMFIHQYTQNLSGHVSELSTQIGSLSAVAQNSSKSLHEYIAKFATHNDPDFIAQGEWMRGILDRYSSLNSSLTALQLSTPWEKPLLFIRHCYPDIAEQTLREFTPGLPFSLEGLCYAIGGMVLFSSFFWSLKYLMRRTYDRLKENRRAKRAHCETSAE